MQACGLHTEGEGRHWSRRGYSAADSGRRWIPVSAGMTVLWGCYDGYFRTYDRFRVRIKVSKHATCFPFRGGMSSPYYGKRVWLRGYGGVVGCRDRFREKPSSSV